MLGRKRRFFEDVSLAVDLVVGILLLVALYYVLALFGPSLQQFFATVTGLELELQPVSHLEEESWLFLVILFNLFAALRITNFYQLDVFASFHRIAFESLKGVAAGIALSAFFLYLFSIPGFNRSLLLGFAVSFYAYQVIKETVLRRYLMKEHYVKKPLEAVLLCPAGDVDQRMAELGKKDLRSMRVSGIALTDGKLEDVPEAHRGLVCGEADELGTILAKSRYDIVFLGVTTGRLETCQAVLNRAEEQGIEVWYFADFLSPILARPVFDEYGGKPMIIFKTTTTLEGQMILKRTFDILVASTAVLFLSPLLLFLAILVKLTSEGPILFKQDRTGWRGRIFQMYKFRTMVKNAPELQRKMEAEHNEMSGPVFKAENDPRITPIGRFLRRYSLDELPQLFNVLRGEMSLVGPRPLPVYETEKFEALRDRRRFSVLPGLTGLWQVSGRSDISDFSEWVKLDLEYIDKWNLWLDIRILFRTIPAVFAASGAK